MYTNGKEMDRSCTLFRTVPVFFFFFFNSNYYNVFVSGTSNVQEDVSRGTGSGCSSGDSFVSNDLQGLRHCYIYGFHTFTKSCSMFACRSIGVVQ